MPANPLVANDFIVRDFRDSMRAAASGLNHGPQLIQQLIESEAWRHRIDEYTRKEVKFDRFIDFVNAKLTAGLEADIETVRMMIPPDDVALRDRLDALLQNPSALHNVQGTSAPTGNSEAAALRRLRSQAPELHAKVLAGELTANAAAVQAGFRHPTLTVRADDAVAAIRTLRRRYSMNEILDAARIVAERE